jgi:hypothetical protein
MFLSLADFIRIVETLSAADAISTVSFKDLFLNVDPFKEDKVYTMLEVFTYIAMTSEAIVLAIYRKGHVCDTNFITSSSFVLHVSDSPHFVGISWPILDDLPGS